MTTRDFVLACHQRIIGTVPDDSELFGAVADIDRGVLSARQFVANLLSATGFAAAPAGGVATGEFVPPGHFYSALPSADDRRRAVAAGRAVDGEVPGIDLGLERQWALLEDLRPFFDSAGIPERPTEQRRYGFDNPAFGSGDALVLQALLRHLRPRRIIEVGSGHSSALMLDVNELHLDGAVHFTFIEPHPELLVGLMRPGDPREAIHGVKVQDVDVELFRSLAANDILFIDSTHVLKAGSDVGRLLFDVLPVLAPGVAVHVHDVFWPFEYPAGWLEEGRAWNEVYALRAFLQYNRCFSIMLFASLLAQRSRGWFERHAPAFLRNVGGSIWLRRVA